MVVSTMRSITSQFPQTIDHSVICVALGWVAKILRHDFTFIWFFWKLLNQLRTCKIDWICTQKKKCETNFIGSIESRSTHEKVLDMVIWIFIPCKNLNIFICFNMIKCLLKSQILKTIIVDYFSDVLASINVSCPKSIMWYLNQFIRVIAYSL